MTGALVEQAVKDDKVDIMHFFDLQVAVLLGLSQVSWVIGCSSKLLQPHSSL